MYSAQYRAGPHRSREIEKQVKTVLDLGVIEPSDAEWFFPVVVVQTPGGHFRFCADYRRLNKRTLNDVYPIPRINDSLNSLGDATVFSTLDCTVGFWKIPVAAEDREKTTFTSHTGLFPFFRLSIGRVNAPASFQGALDIILSGIHWQTCLLYRYDVIVIYRTVNDHIQHRSEVLVLQGKAGFSLKPSKCHLFHQEFEYLGQVVRPGRLRGNQKNIKSLPQVLFPLNHTELKSFLCMCNMHRRIIEDYAHITKPLTELTSTKLPHVLPTLDAAQMEAFEYLKERLTSTSILALPRTEGLFILDTDACAVQVGCTPSAATRQDHSSGRILNPGPHIGRIKQLENRPRTPGCGLCLFFPSPLPRGTRVPDQYGPFQFTLAAQHEQCKRTGLSLAPPLVGFPVQDVHHTGKRASPCRRYVASPNAGASPGCHPGSSLLPCSG